MPSRSFLSPKPGVPGEDFLVNRSEHNQDQTDRGKLLEHAKYNSETAGNFRRAEKKSEAFAHTNTFAACGWIFYVAPAAGEEDNADHQSQQEKAEIGEAGELRKHKDPYTGKRSFKDYKKIRVLAFVGQECPTHTVVANPKPSILS